MQLVLSVFPGGGKSSIFKEAEQLGLKKAHVSWDERNGVEIMVPRGPGVPVFDSDSSIFPKDGFPGNYIAHIQNVLSTYPNVVIMVSSHDNVRAALHEEGIPFTLVYPERELKGEYLERYEGRGSPEAFVNMMDNKWNDFIDSANSDVNQDRIILGEGKYLLNAVKEKIQEVVLTADAETGVITGFESMGDIIRTSDGRTFDSSSSEGMNEYYAHKKALMNQEGINVAILDANANVDEASGIISQPSTLEPSVMNSPENSVDINETAGGQPAVDASTVDDSAMDHSDIVEAYYETDKDIAVIESVIKASANSETAGIECIQDNSEEMVNASTYLKEKYGADVEPTISGLEGFLDKLKSLYEATKGRLKKSNEKKGKIGKYAYEVEKAVNEYKSSGWLDKQTFIENGTVKVQVPGILAGIKSPADIKTIIDGLNKPVVSAFDKHLANDKARIISATKVFNKVKGLNATDPISKLEDLLPIKPEALEGGTKDAGLAQLKLGLSAIELPALSKDGVKQVCGILDDMIDVLADFFNKEDSLDDTHIDEDDWWNSEYLEEHMHSNAAKQLWNAGTYAADVPQYAYIDQEYSKVLLEVGKFIESWILKSTK